MLTHSKGVQKHLVPFNMKPSIVSTSDIRICFKKITLVPFNDYLERRNMNKGGYIGIKE
uniref:Uncharacterized protein n=1 Tax=Lepeophtheirus salmonis TaxID=72036 RepID=A0A0K2UIB7_LEPSM